MENLSYLSGKFPDGFEINFNRIDYYLDRYTEEEGKEEAIIFYDSSLNRRSLTRSKWSIDSLNFAYNLLPRVKKGHKFGLLLPNIPEFPICFHGLQRLGINTFLNPSVDVFKVLCTDIKFHGIITLSSYWKILKGTKGAKDIPIVILIEDEVLESKRGDEIDYESLVVSNTDKPKLPKVQNDDDLVVTMTSGSDGKPKLSQGSQRGVMNVFGNIGKTPLIHLFKGIGFSDRPFAYSGGIIFIYSFMVGQKVVTTEHPCAKGTKISTTDIGKIISKENCQIALLFAYLLYDVVNNPAALQEIAKSVRSVITAGQPIIMPILEKFWEIAPQLPVIDMYAATELGMVFAKSRTKANPNPLPKATFGTELSIRDSKGDVANRNEIGEIWVKSFSQLRFYVQNPMLTSQTLTTNGWVKSGDLALMTDDGDIIFQGKTSEVIKIAALKMFPQTIEKKLNNHKCIEVSLVVELPDNRLGSVLGLVIKLEKEWINKQDEARTEIERYFKENFKDNEETGVLYPIGKISFVDDWPMTDSQKILRRKVKEMCINGQI